MNILILRMPYVPPIINCNTSPIKNNKVLAWYKGDQPVLKKGEHFGAIVTSVQDLVKYKGTCPILVAILTSVTGDDIDLLLKNKDAVSNYFVSQAVFQQVGPMVWQQNRINVAVLEGLAQQYPILEYPWDGTELDAVTITCMLFHLNHILVPVGTSLSTYREAQRTQYGIQVTSIDKFVVPEIWFITQYFVHSMTKRAKEIRQCLKNNMALSYIDRIVLLNETNLSYEWSGSKGSEKVVQEIIGTRLTYADLLRYTYEKVPPNTIVIFANADIYCNKSLSHLYSTNLADQMYALLRYDEGSSSEDLKLFGPRPDSQDAWIVHSDSVKSRDWKDFKTFHYQLGTAGCDNRFTGDMFAMRFLISNPCHTIQTVHLHKTEIRNYNPRDIQPAKLYLYIHPCAIIEMINAKEGGSKTFSLSPRLGSVSVKTLVPKKGLTFCTMLARENRFKWNTEVANAWSAKALPVYKWSKAFVTSPGIVYDYKNLYTGTESETFFQKIGRNLEISFLKPVERAHTMVAVPCATVQQMTHPDLYCLYYLSYVIQVLEHVEGVASFFIHQPCLNTLEAFQVKPGFMGAFPVVAWNPGCVVYANEIYGCLPSAAELSPNEIDALRSRWSGYKGDMDCRCVILTDEIFTEEFCMKVLGPLLPSYEIVCLPRTVVGPDAYKVLAGAGLCILYNLPKQDDQWAKLWALPKGCSVLEFQNELKVEGGFQHFAAMAGFDTTLIPLHKGPIDDLQGQVVEQIKACAIPVKKPTTPQETTKPENVILLSV